MSLRWIVLGGLLLAGCPKKPVPIGADPGTGGAPGQEVGELPPLDPSQSADNRVNEAADAIERGTPQDLARAVQLLESVANDDATGVARFNLGLAYQKQGDLTRAANQYQSVIAAHPDNGDAWLGLGNVQALQGDSNAAFATWETGIRNDPENIGLRVARIGALRELGRIDEAIAASKEALKINAKSVAVYNNFGLAYLDKGNLVLAKFIFQKAVQEIDGAEDNALLQTNLGWTLYRDDNSPAATEHLKKALELDPNLVPALVYLSRVYMDDHNYDETVPLLENAARLDPNNADVQLTLGVAYRGTGRLDEAEKAYQRALSLNPSDPSPHLNLGVLRGDYRKDYDGAVDEFSKYISSGGKEKALAETYIRDVKKEKELSEKRVAADAEKKARDEERKRKEAEAASAPAPAPEGTPPAEPGTDEAPPEEPPPEEAPSEEPATPEPGGEVP